VAKTFVSTFGFTESLVLAPIIKLGLTKDDRLIILTPAGLGNEERTRNALRKLREMLNAISGGTFNLKTTKIKITDFADSVRQIRELITKEAEEGREVHINISGGMRALIIETYTATLLARTTKENIKFTELELEGSTGNIKIIPITPQKRLNKTKKKILKELAKEKKPMEMKKLSEKTRLSLPTISRNLKELTANQLIALKKEKRKILAQITKEGKLFI